jgi:hypothetical protein
MVDNMRDKRRLWQLTFHHVEHRSDPPVPALMQSRSSSVATPVQPTQRTETIMRLSNVINTC